MLPTPTERRSRKKTARNATPNADLSAIGWLGSDQHSASVLTTARMLLAIEQAAGEILPPALRQVCRVARIDRQQVTLAVPGAAHAAKLRQLAPRIAQRLSEGGWNLNQVQIRVQAGLSHIGTNPPRAKNVEPLGAKALDAFEALHAALRPGPLADAVSRLLAHHKP